MRPAREGARSAARPLVAVTLAAAAIAVAPVSVGSTAALFSAKGTATTTITTAAACASGPDAPYATYLTGLADQPLLWWRFGEAAGATTVADAAGGDDGGTVVGSAPGTVLTFGAAGQLECDATGALAQAAAPAGTGLVVLPAARPDPGTYSVAVWVSAASGATGGLWSFGDSATGASTSRATGLSIDAQGRAELTVTSSSGPVVLRSSVVDPLTDGAPHLLLATADASGGQADVTLYLDGVAVDSVTGMPLPTPGSGYWQTGGADGPGAAATVDELAVWEGVSLTAGQAFDLVSADHW